MREISEETLGCKAFNKRYCYLFELCYVFILSITLTTSKRILDLYSTGIEKGITTVKEISSTYNRFWNYDGRIKGLNPYLRQLECENITGSSCKAQAFSSLGRVHLFWEGLPSLADDEFGLEVMNADAFYALSNSG